MRRPRTAGPQPRHDARGEQERRRVDRQHPGRAQQRHRAARQAQAHDLRGPLQRAGQPCAQRVLVLVQQQRPQRDPRRNAQRLQARNRQRRRRQHPRRQPPRAVEQRRQQHRRAASHVAQRHDPPQAPAPVRPHARQRLQQDCRQRVERHQHRHQRRAARHLVHHQRIGDHVQRVAKAADRVGRQQPQVHPLAAQDGIFVVRRHANTSFHDHLTKG